MATKDEHMNSSEAGDVDYGLNLQGIEITDDRGQSLVRRGENDDAN